MLTNAFSKFSQAFVTPNQKVLTIAKLWINSFMSMAYLLKYIMIKAAVLKIISWPSCTPHMT